LPASDNLTGNFKVHGVFVFARIASGPVETVTVHVRIKLMKTTLSLAIATRVQTAVDLDIDGHAKRVVAIRARRATNSTTARHTSGAKSIVQSWVVTTNFLECTSQSIDSVTVASHTEWANVMGDDVAFQSRVGDSTAVCVHRARTAKDTDHERRAWVRVPVGALRAAATSVFDTSRQSDQISQRPTADGRRRRSRATTARAGVLPRNPARRAGDAKPTIA
jgi:hypothetical protein